MYTSTIDIVIGHDEIVNGDESTPPPNRHLFPGYNETKRKAEEMVIAANGRSLANGTVRVAVAVNSCGSCDMYPHNNLTRRKNRQFG